MEELWRELVYVTYHLHWTMDAVLNLEHDDRHRVIREIASLNERALEGYR
ncbi:MAG: DUF6760 family protein [Dehalococcoidia bacterium]